MIGDRLGRFPPNGNSGVIAAGNQLNRTAAIGDDLVGQGIRLEPSPAFAFVRFPIFYFPAPSMGFKKQCDTSVAAILVSRQDERQIVGADNCPGLFLCFANNAVNRVFSKLQMSCTKMKKAIAISGVSAPAGVLDTTQGSSAARSR